MSAQDDAAYIFNMFTRESNKFVEMGDIVGKYRGYAIGQCASLWQRAAAEARTDEMLAIAARDLLSLLQLEHYKNPVEEGSRQGFAWVRNVLHENFD